MAKPELHENILPYTGTIDVTTVDEECDGTPEKVEVDLDIAKNPVRSTPKLLRGVVTLQSLLTLRSLQSSLHPSALELATASSEKAETVNNSIYGMRQVLANLQSSMEHFIQLSRPYSVAIIEEPAKKSISKVAGAGAGEIEYLSSVSQQLILAQTELRNDLQRLAGNHPRAVEKSTAIDSGVGHCTTAISSLSLGAVEGESTQISLEERREILKKRLKAYLLGRLLRQLQSATEDFNAAVKDFKLIALVKRQQRAKADYLQRRILETREEITTLSSRPVTMLNAKLIDMRERLLTLNAISKNGVFLWTITGVRQRIEDAKAGRRTSFYSQAFYVSRFGYKLALRLYLNGDGLGKNSYLSLFVVLLQSPYDAIQRWPFSQKITVILYDHHFNQHVIDAFKPDVYNVSFRKPENAMNLASGSSLFLPLSLFEQPQARSQSPPETDEKAVDYYYTDTLFIKVIVDSSDLPLTNALVPTMASSSGSDSKSSSSSKSSASR